MVDIINLETKQQDQSLLKSLDKKIFFLSLILSIFFIVTILYYVYVVVSSLSKSNLDGENLGLIIVPFILLTPLSGLITIYGLRKKSLLAGITCSIIFFSSLFNQLKYYLTIKQYNTLFLNKGYIPSVNSIKNELQYLELTVVWFIGFLLCLLILFWIKKFNNRLKQNGNPIYSNKFLQVLLTLIATIISLSTLSTLFIIVQTLKPVPSPLEISNQNESALDVNFGGEEKRDLIEQLRSKGFNVFVSDAVAGVIGPEYSLGGRDNVIKINNADNIALFGYSSADKAHNDQLLMPKDGIVETLESSLKKVQGHLFVKDKIIVYYGGTNSKILAALTDLLGNEFAGPSQPALSPEPVDNTGIKDYYSFYTVLYHTPGVIMNEKMSGGHEDFFQAGLQIPGTIMGSGQLYFMFKGATDGVMIFTYLSYDDLEKDMSFVSKDGVYYRGKQIFFDYSNYVPHYWKNSRVVVVYDGKNQNTIDLMTKIFGASFIGK